MQSEVPLALKELALTVGRGQSGEKGDFLVKNIGFEALETVFAIG